MNGPQRCEAHADITLTFAYYHQRRFYIGILSRWMLGRRATQSQAWPKRPTWLLGDVYEQEEALPDTRLLQFADPGA